MGEIVLNSWFRLGSAVAIQSYIDRGEMLSLKNHLTEKYLYPLASGIITPLASKAMIDNAPSTFRNFFILALMSMFSHAYASPILNERVTVNGTINPSLCLSDSTPPDSDLMGLGVRIGIYLQILALALGVCCGQSDTLSAVPAAIMTSLTLNIVLTMKAGQKIFGANPVVQDFWVTQLQLFLLVTLLPFMFMFGHWHHKVFGMSKCLLVALAIVYTYAQTFWFWLVGYQLSDEMVCGVAQTELFDHIKLFSQGGRFAIVTLFVLGLAIIFIMVPNFIRGCDGYLTWVVHKGGGESDWSKVLVLLIASTPLVTIVLVMIETAVRTGTQNEWQSITGQWLALGVGVFTAAEALWHVVKAIYRELRGGEFFEGAGFLGDKSTQLDGSTELEVMRTLLVKE